MGNVACCKKPNEIIEDRDLFKKSSYKKEINFEQDFSEPEFPFLKNESKVKQDKDTNINLNNNMEEINNSPNNNIQEKYSLNKNMNYDIYKNSNYNTNYNTNIAVEKEEKKIIDIEEKRIDHQSTLGPSDNLRNKKNKNQQISQSPKDAIYNNNYKITKNEFEQKPIQGEVEINKYEERKRGNQPAYENNRTEQVINANVNINKNFYYQQNLNNNYNNNQFQTKNVSLNQQKKMDDNSETGPLDRVRKSNKLNNPNNNEIKQIKEPTNSSNYINQEKQIIGSEVKNQRNFQQKLVEEKYKYYVQPSNQSVEFVNNSKYFSNSASLNMSNENNLPKSQNQIQTQVEKSEININQNKQSIEQIPQNSSTLRPNNNINYNNTQQIEQKLTNPKSEIDDDIPKDSVIPNQNQIQQNIQNQNESENENENENIENNNNENSQVKEAYIQNQNGQIFPTIQLSDSEIEILYNKCLSKGSTEPDDDFSPEKYKQFYPEDEPFFNFDKGEVFQGQIISNPDDDNNIEIYEGEINENNKKHGFGISTTPLYVRKGTWRNGQFTGWGRESRRNGDVIEGKFINGVVNGKGTLKNNRGNIYVGDFVNSQREGYGELNTNRIHYIGEFKEDKLHGKGVIDFLKEGHRYEGEFKNNEINGKGVFRWKNGDVYEGEMSNGKMNGHGTYKYSDGQIYDGEYLNGLREGKGRIIYSNQVIYEGEFKKGHRFENGNIVDSTRINDNNDDGNNNDDNNINQNEGNYDNNEEYPQDN